MRINMLLLGVGIALIASQNCRAECEEDSEYFLVRCVKFEVDPITGEDVPRQAQILLRTLADPQDPNATVWGSYKVYHHDTDLPGDDCNGDKKNCQDEDYTYAVANINANWSVTDPRTGLTWTKADNERYWDWKYLTEAQGYTKMSGIDYTKNCHGYAFGLGHQVHNGADGVYILINNPPGQIGQPVCYSAAGECDAEFAVQTNGAHSMKIISCEVCEDPTGVILGITETRENFRESGVYKKTIACEDGGINPDNPVTTPTVDDAFLLYKTNTTP